MSFQFSEEHCGVCFYYCVVRETVNCQVMLFIFCFLFLTVKSIEIGAK